MGIYENRTETKIKMMLLPKNIILVFLIFQVNSCHAFIGNIGQQIVDGIKNAFVGFFNFIADGIVSLIKWIGVSLKDEVIHLSEDISEALSITTDLVSSQANKTLDGIFGTAGGVFNTKKLIMNFMYKGEIPIPDLQK